MLQLELRLMRFCTWQTSERSSLPPLTSHCCCVLVAAFFSTPYRTDNQLFLCGRKFGNVNNCIFCMRALICLSVLRLAYWRLLIIKSFGFTRLHKKGQRSKAGGTKKMSSCLSFNNLNYEIWSQRSHSSFPCLGSRSGDVSDKKSIFCNDTFSIHKWCN